MKLNRSGFTFMEVMVALAISLGIIFFSNFMIIQLAKENSLFFNANLSRIDLSITSLALKNQVNNSMRIYPSEPLANPTDLSDTRIYTGVAPLDAALAPAICQNDSQFSTLRVTYIDRRKKAERLLRLWSEDMADVESSANELRVTLSADADPTNAFLASNFTEEVVLVDLDGVIRRRFSVNKVIDRIDVEQDPADDLMKIKPDGSYEKFTYKAIHLNKPMTASGHVVPVGSSAFITKSFAYPAYTRIICARKSDKSIVSINERDGKIIVLYEGFSNGYDITGFTTTFGGTRRDARINHGHFLTPDQYYMPKNGYKLNCINVVDIDFSLQKRTPTTDLKTNSLHKQNTILLKNFLGQRLAACDASKITEAATYDSRYDFDVEQP